MVNTAGWILYAIFTAAFGYGFWRATRHLNETAAETRREETLRRALHAHDEDINQLTRAGGLADDEFVTEFRKWQARQ